MDARVDAESIEANLQVRTPDGRRVDVELIGRSQGASVRVWIEAKWNAAFGDDQLVVYAESLGDRGKLVALLPARRTSEVLEPFKALTWERIAVLADKQGIAGGGQQWRDGAYEPYAVARQRVLALFLDHLEMEHHMTVSPLLTEHALAIRLADDAITIADNLAEEAIRRAGLRSNVCEHFLNNAGAFWTFSAQEELSPVWHPEGHAELHRSPNGLYQIDGPPEPVFLCGYTLPKSAAEWLETEHLQEWRARLEADRPPFLLSGGRPDFTRVYTAMPLAVLATASASFDGQARILADWISEAFARVHRLDPGVIWNAT